jgi:ribosomal protein S18 acetylase RimI-like enzyme
VIIRRFETKDADVLARLSKLASKEKRFEKESAKDFLKIYKRNKNLIWVAEENSDVIAYLYGEIVSRKDILSSSEGIELAMVYVNKEYRNKRVATKLVKRFLKAWKNSKYKGVFSLATNKIAASLLKDVGFRQRVYYLEKKF